ncbi:MlaD family protein [[Mycobacterium] wendilense]|uniref:Mammalian cell entry related domain protein n=1 Tax=[Mycobacterium] wendilense TaxID=3064284 RepID=A0ABN9NVJ5_9MYCO|nr:MlaD family protein [Mycolicibacterium sp. MU0050]CAJ1579466.1 Mammalian cell entry related domain protein [Mycolicibacterium sp. MU0050]
MLFRTSPEREARTLRRTGLVIVAVVTLTVALIVIDPSDRRSDSRASLTVDTPYVGAGVDSGTPVILHGARVGEVASVASRADGGTRVQLRLQPTPTQGLTATLAIDFRPANYFGITGVNLIPGPSGGKPLRDGAHLELVPQGNYTMQALLSRVGEFTNGVVTPELVSVIDRATRYVDGLNPMLETLLLVTSTVTEVQTVSAEQMIRNMAGIGVAAPPFVDAMTNLADRLANAGLDVDEQFFQDRFLATLQLAATGLFGSVGKLLSSNVRNMLPATEVVQTLTRPVPGIAQADNIGATLVELRGRFERMYEGSGDQRALQVNIILDSLPGVAGPLQAMGATP